MRELRAGDLVTYHPAFCYIKGIGLVIDASESGHSVLWTGGKIRDMSVSSRMLLVLLQGIKDC